jgi:hypothetical protein
VLNTRERKIGRQQGWYFKGIHLITTGNYKLEHP